MESGSDLQFYGEKEGGSESDLLCIKLFGRIFSQVLSDSRKVDGRRCLFALVCFLMIYRHN